MSKALDRFHQPISVPGKRLLHHIALGFVKHKVTGGGRRSVNQELPLIPFIDFLLCIVLFLLAMSGAKFALVALFFMHLRYESRVPTFLFVGPLVLASGLAVALMTLTGAFLVFGR